MLVIAEDYATLYQVNEKCSGHAVILPPAPYSHAAGKLGSQMKPLEHSDDLLPPGKKGRAYICSCMIFLLLTDGAKLVMKKWIEDVVLDKTTGQAAFPTGGLYFKKPDMGFQ